MSALKAIAALPLGDTIDPDKGPSPQLQWIAITDLRVDPAYQRQVTATGEKNIRAIARAFRWSKFAPVIVSPVEGGVFAVIDGQHRVTAAVSIGVKQVPCQVILADAAEHAAAFSAINGNVTRIHALALHRAAVAAGEADAVALDALTRRCGVRILGYPKQEAKQSPGETMALETLRRGLRAHGAAIVALALTAVMGGDHAVAGCLSATILDAAIDFAGDERRSGATEAQITAFLGRRNLLKDFERVRAQASIKGVTRSQQLRTVLVQEFAVGIPTVKAPQAPVPVKPPVGTLAPVQSRAAPQTPTVVALASPDAMAHRATSTTQRQATLEAMPPVVKGVGFTPRETHIVDLLLANPHVLRSRMLAALSEFGLGFKDPEQLHPTVIVPLTGRLAKIGVRLSAIPGGVRLDFDSKTRLRALIKEARA